MALATLPHRSRIGLSRPFAVVALLVLAAATLLGAGLSFVTPNVEPFPAVATFPVADIPVDRPVFYRPFDMGTSGHGIPLGIWLVRDGDRVLALYSHDDLRSNNCAIEEIPGSVAQSDAWFISGSVPGVSAQRWTECPSFRWTRTGVLVMGGPRDMDRFDVAIEDDVVRIDVSRLRLGNCGAGVRFEDGLRCPYSTDEAPAYLRTNWPRIPRS